MRVEVWYCDWDKLRDLEGRVGGSLFFGVSVRGDVLHNEPGLYAPVGYLECKPSDEPETVSERAFRAFNRVEPGDMEGLHIRSMSVGDFVLFPDGRMYVCQGMGWREESFSSFGV